MSVAVGVVFSPGGRVYSFDPAGHKKHHSKICTEAKQGSVTGVVDEKKLVITVKDVKFK